MTPSTATKTWLLDFSLLAAIWGSSFLFMRLGASEFGALPTAGVRVAMASCFLLPLVLWRGLGPPLLKHWKKTFLVGLINSGIPFACYSYALLSITTGLSSIINATAPMFGALIAWIWLKDRPHGLRILGLLIGFVGVALLVWDKASFKPEASGHATAWAVLACLVACIFYGISANYAKRYLQGIPPLVTATGSQLGATLGLALPTLWLWPQHTPSTQAWLALLCVGVLCTGVAYILYFKLIETVGPARALTVNFVAPVFALFYGRVFLSEAVSPWMVFCGVVIVCGTMLSSGLITLKPSIKSS